MFLQAYQSALSILAKRPIRLWGLSLLSGVVCIFASVLTMPALSIVGAAFSMVVAAGMAKVYLDALDHKEINADQLFAGFKRFWPVLGGLAWQALWIFIWTFGATAVATVVYLAFTALGLGFRIPVVFSFLGGFLAAATAIGGVVIVCIKSYAYSFVPYILMTRPDVSATDALRLSVKLTRGKKGQMFLADFLFALASVLIVAVLAALSFIPYIGGVFAVVLVAFALALLLFSAIFRGLYMASFYMMPGVTTVGDTFEAKVEELTERLLDEEPQAAEGPAEAAEEQPVEPAEEPAEAVEEQPVEPAEEPSTDTTEEPQA